jgi:ATP-binding cassette subfamily F protein 3
LSKNQRHQLERRINEIEKLIPQLEDDATKLSLEMALPQIASDFGKLNELTEKHRELQSRIQSLYAEWEGASEQIS